MKRMIHLPINGYLTDRPWTLHRRMDLDPKYVVRLRRRDLAHRIQPAAPNRLQGYLMQGSR